MSNLRIEAFISPKISTADRSRRERAIKTKKPRQRLGFFRYISFLYTVMVPVVGLEIGHRHRPACAPRRTVQPDTISRPLKSRHRRDFPLRVAASSPSFTVTNKNTPIRRGMFIIAKICRARFMPARGAVSSAGCYCAKLCT